MAPMAVPYRAECALAQGHRPAVGIQMHQKLLPVIPPELLQLCWKILLYHHLHNLTGYQGPYAYCGCQKDWAEPRRGGGGRGQKGDSTPLSHVPGLERLTKSTQANRHANRPSGPS